MMDVPHYMCRRRVRFSRFFAGPVGLEFLVIMLRAKSFA